MRSGLRLPVVWLAATLIAAVGGCKDPFGAPPPRKLTNQQVTQALATLNISLPVTAAVVNSEFVTGWQDESLVVQITMPREDLSEFLAGSPFAGAELQSKQSEVWVPHAWGWKAETCTSFRSGQVALPDAEFLSILIDESSPETLIVCIRWNET